MRMSAVIARPPAACLALLLSGALAGCVSTASGAPRPMATAVAVPATPVLAATASGQTDGSLASGLAEADRQRAYDAEVTALETGGPGYPVGWRGEANVRGTVIAGPTYNRSGFTSCRDYSHTIYVGDRPQIARGAACRNAEGKWQPVG